MPYPWASFGGFYFQHREIPIHPTDRGWELNPSYQKKRPNGSVRDSIITMAIGSMTRTFEMYMTQDRYNVLQALVNTTALFTDWRRPVPDSRQAFLDNVTPVEQNISSVECPPGENARSVRARITLTSQ